MSQDIVIQTQEVVSNDYLASFQSALLAMDDYRAQLAEAGDWNTLAVGLVNLNDFKTNLIMLIQQIELDIYGLMPDKKTVIEGVGILEKRRANTKKWESNRLLEDIVSSKLQTETGEIHPSDIFSLIDTLQRVLPLTGSLGWRTGELKKENIDIEDYCSVTWGRQTISITK
jgi:hypothetical protein